AVTPGPGRSRVAGARGRLRALLRIALCRPDWRTRRFGTRGVGAAGAARQREPVYRTSTGARPGTVVPAASAPARNTGGAVPPAQRIGAPSSPYGGLAVVP